MLRREAQNDFATLSREAGAVLIGIIMFGAVLTIAMGAALLLASQNSTRYEDAYQDLLLYHAAESGVQVAFDALHDPNQVPDSVNNTLILSNLSINGYTVTPRIKVLNKKANPSPYPWDSVRVVISGEVNVAPSAMRPVVWRHKASCRSWLFYQTPTKVRIDSCLHQALPEFL